MKTYLQRNDNNPHVFELVVEEPATMRDVMGAVTNLCQLLGKGFGYFPVQFVGAVQPKGGTLLLLHERTPFTTTMHWSTATIIAPTGEPVEIAISPYAPCVAYITISEENHHVTMGTAQTTPAAVTE